MEPEYYEAFSAAKKENYKLIYGNPQVDDIYKDVKPMFAAVYETLLEQARKLKEDSIFLATPHFLYSGQQLSWDCL